MSGSDFQFTLADLSNDDWTKGNAFVKAQNKWNATGKPMKSTRSVIGIDTAADQSALSISDILQNIPLYNDQGDVMQKQSYVMENLLSGFTGKGGQNGTAGLGTGIDDLIPNDLKKAQQLQTNQGYIDSGANLFQSANNSVDTLTQDQANQLVGRTDKIHFSDDAKGQAALKDFTDGKMSSNVVTILGIIANNYEITISGTTTGVSDGSDLHGDGRAVDVSIIKDPLTNTTHVCGGDSNNVPLLGLLTLINTFSPANQTGEILCDIDPHFNPHFGTSVKCSDHLHIGFTDRGDPPPLPADASADATGTTATGGTTGTGTDSGAPGNTTGASVDGVVWPFDTKSETQYQRIDSGWDIQTVAGGPVYAIASGTLSVFKSDPGGFGDDYPVQKLDTSIGGPSDWVYYGHVHILPGLDGQHVNAGQKIATTNVNSGDGESVAPPGWLEIGFAQPGTDAPFEYGAGEAHTTAGQAMHDILINAMPFSASQDNPKPKGVE